MEDRQQIRILLIEDNPQDVRLIGEMLMGGSNPVYDRPQLQVDHCSTLADGLALIVAEAIDVTLLDLNLPDSQGLESVWAVHNAAPNLPIIVLTGFEDDQLAQAAVHGGAQDYLEKGHIDEHILYRAISYAIERQRLRDELEQKAKDLTASEKRLVHLIKHNADGILVVGAADGLVRFANPAAERIFDSSAAELTSKPFGFPLIGDQTIEIDLINPHGQVKTVEVRAVSSDWEGEPAHFAALRDISDHIRIQGELREAEIRYRTLIDESLQGVVVVQNDRIVFANNVFSEITGFAAGELQRIGFSEMAENIHPDDRAKILNNHQNLLLGQTTATQLEYRQYNAQGQLLWLQMRSSVTQHNDQPAILALYLDVTERRQAEETLKNEHRLLAQRVEERTAELRRSNLHLTQALRIKSEFLATMSHELRTPLNAILGMCEILDDAVYGTLNENQLSSVNIVKHSGQHLLSLINNILDVAKIEADKLQLELGPVSAVTVSETSLQLIQDTARQKNIRTTTTITPSDFVFQADERRIKQILTNLLSNAVKFTPDNGEIGLDINATEAQNMITFTVWDTGIGISAENQETIFQPFEQLDGRLARQYEGTGMGLTLTKLLAELHGGRITVTSAPGQGSSFEFKMPWYHAKTKYAAD
jgi:PAS domain S-box-containing protein